eukprot:Lithocolla_globosa_v1_NODE_11850_length_479_cov_2.846698.p3 type:complete len:107 gc:universal NODE_11850_length_479_cov_2.846698:430-110(-)
MQSQAFGSANHHNGRHVVQGHSFEQPPGQRVDDIPRATVRAGPNAQAPQPAVANGSLPRGQDKEHQGTRTDRHNVHPDGRGGKAAWQLQPLFHLFECPAEWTCGTT